MRVGVKTSLKLAIFGICAFCVGYFFYKFFYADSLLGDFRTSRDPFVRDYSKVLLDRNNKLLSVFLNQNEQWHLKASVPISHKLRIAVLEYEDKHFFSHIGVDFLAIARTLRDNFRAVLPNAPGLINLEKNHHTLKTKRDSLLERLHKKGHFDAQILYLVQNEPIPSKFIPRINLAPHLAKISLVVSVENFTGESNSNIMGLKSSS